MKRKDRVGLISLADIPALEGKKMPRATIPIAKLGRYTDPRYGSFSIAQKDFDGWSRNLTETFGGRVSVDWDHGSERQGNTKAAGWVVGLRQDGDTVLADVEFTKAGAKSIRRKEYQFVSPTFKDHYVTERGEDRGKALLGIALTNKPVLRDLPAINLSRTPVDGFAELSQPPARPASPSRVPSNPTSSRPTKRGRTAGNGPKGKKGKSKKNWAKKRARIARSRVADDPAVWNSKPAAKVSQSVKKMAQIGDLTVDEVARTLDRAGETAKAVRKMLAADGMPAGQARTLTSDMAPQLLDQFTPARRSVYAMTPGGGVYQLAADPIAGIGEGAEPRAHERVDPDRAALDRNARALAGETGLSYVDAVVAIEDARHGLELAKVDGSSTLDFQDTSAPRPVDPVVGKDREGNWTQAREELYQRDVRRAAAAGVQDLSREVWDAHSELGRDYAFEAAEQARAAAVAQHEAVSANHLAAAKQRAEVAQVQARNQRALERQQTQQARARQAREDQIHGRSVAGNADHTGPTVPW